MWQRTGQVTCTSTRQTETLCGNCQCRIIPSWQVFGNYNLFLGLLKSSFLPEEDSLREQSCQSNPVQKDSSPSAAHSPSTPELVGIFRDLWRENLAVTWIHPQLISPPWLTDRELSQQQGDIIVTGCWCRQVRKTSIRGLYLWTYSGSEFLFYIRMVIWAMPKRKHYFYGEVFPNRGPLVLESFNTNPKVSQRRRSGFVKPFASSTRSCWRHFTHVTPSRGSELIR